MAWAVGLLACSAPLLSAASWVTTGVSGPVHQVASPLVPEVVAAASGQSDQVRTLVLRSAHGQVSYLLLRGPSPTLADAALTPPPAARQALAKAVADLIAPDGGLARDQGQMLADFDIGYVLLETPVDQSLAAVLNNVRGLQAYSNTSSGDYLWQLVTSPARVSVLERNGTVVPIPSGPVGVSGAVVPAAGGTLLLAEPSGGWSASVNGQALTQVPSPAGSWAQAFQLPPGGGQLDISRSGFWHDAALALELLAFLALAGLALPGVHVAEQDAQRAATVSADARRATGGTRHGQERGRRAAGGDTAGDDDGADDELDADAGGQDGDSAANGGSWRRIGSVGAGTDRAGRSSRGSGGRRRVALLAATGRARSGGARSGGARAGQAGAGSSSTRGSSTEMTSTERADAGRGDTGRAGAGRVGAGRGGGDQAGRPGVAAAGAAATGFEAAAQRTRLSSDLLSAYGGRGDPADRRAARPAGAWPYADADDRAAGRAAGRSSGPQARAWPYLDDDDQDVGSTAGSFATEPPGRPYSTGEHERGAGRRAEPAGRSPSSRSPSEDERGIGRRAEPAGRSPSSRSPSGSVPPSAWSEPAGRTGEQAGYDRPARGTSGRSGGSHGSSPRESTAYYGGRGDRDGGGYGDELDSRDDRAGARGRDELDRTGQDRAGQDRTGQDRAGQDKTGGSGRSWSGLRGGLERRAPNPAPVQQRSAFERAGWRLGGGRSGKSPDREAASPRGPGESVRAYERLGPSRGGDDVYEPGEQRRGRSDAGRDRDAEPVDYRAADSRPGDYRSGDRPRDSRTGEHRSGEYRSGEYRSGEHRSGEYRSGERQPAERQSGEHRRSDFGAQRPGSDRRGGRDAGEPDWRESGSGRATSAHPDWAETGDRGLDPLQPRPGASARPGARRRNVWRPDAGGADSGHDEQGRHAAQGYDQPGYGQQWSDDNTDWQRLRSGAADYDRDLGRRWLDPEPEHEGDSW
jgi:hypothetical protein